MESIVGFASLSFLIVINLLIVSYTYGRINQNIADLNRRVERLEKKYNNVR